LERIPKHQQSRRRKRDGKFNRDEATQAGFDCEPAGHKAGIAFESIDAGKGNDTEQELELEPEQGEFESQLERTPLDDHEAT
jgi:hypothetical protein